jgi:hypothetical protein
VNFLGRGRRDHHILVVRDQRVLGAVADLGPVGDIGHLAALVGGFLEMLEIIQPDAIKGARHHRQFDLHLRERMRARRALPFAKGVAADRDHAVALDDAPGGLSIRGEFQPAHLLSLLFGRGLRLRLPGAGGRAP